MARRITPAQFRAQVQRAQQQRKQAINRLNGEIRKHNQAVDNYNSSARQHNAQERANRDRLRRELARLNSSSRTATTTRVAFRSSVTTVQEAYLRVEEAASSDRWVSDDNLLELIEGEAANSAATWNVLTGEAAEVRDGEPELADTRITDELTSIDPELRCPLAGALYALNPANPDAARHFCASSRELIDSTSSGRPQTTRSRRSCRTTRRHRKAALLGVHVSGCAWCARVATPLSFTNFVDSDLENVIQLFGEFNDGTHGSAGHFTVGQLRTTKQRVEDALQFLYEVVR